MQRCIHLAKLAGGAVYPNPLVGAVLVHNRRIIGEGFHREFGKAHAEVNCIHAVSQHDRSLIPESTLYVSLEPCAHFGKTPPCVDLILEQKIKNVVVGSRDPFFAVDGKGIERLRASGVNVTVGVCEQECQILNKRFFHFHTRHRPYVVLKWAETADGKIGSGTTERLMISNDYSSRLVHCWRTEEMGILVGTNTVEKDDPLLTSRSWPGKNPIRLVLDMQLRLPGSHTVFNDDAPTIVFNTKKHSLQGVKLNNLEGSGIQYYQLGFDTDPVIQILNGCYQLGIQSILVEGGAQLLQSFIDSCNWDEAKIIKNTSLNPGSGLSAPVLSNHVLLNSIQLENDTVCYYRHTSNQILGTGL